MFEPFRNHRRPLIESWDSALLYRRNSSTRPLNFADVPEASSHPRYRFAVVLSITVVRGHVHPLTLSPFTYRSRVLHSFPPTPYLWVSTPATWYHRPAYNGYTAWVDRVWPPTSFTTNFRPWADRSNSNHHSPCRPNDHAHPDPFT